MKTFRKIISFMSVLAMCISVGSFKDMSINNVSAISGDSVSTVESDSKLADYCEQVVELVNSERVKQGLTELTYNNALKKASAKRASELVELYSHNRPDNRNCATILGEYGISTMKHAENIATTYPYGVNPPENVVNGWLNSSEHRASILNPDYKNIGVGVAYYNGGYYWVQIFSSDIVLSEDVTWNLDNNGTLTVNGTGDMPDKLSLFSLRSNVRKAVIGENMKSMNCYDLSMCKNLSEVTILNPECQINNSGYNIQADTIYGYADSTAQTYAKNKNKSFVTIYSNPYQTTTTDRNIIYGDADGDGKVSVADAVLIMQYIINPDEFSISEECSYSADVVNTGDGLTTMDALAIQMVNINLLSIEDLPITSEKLQSLVQ